MKSAIYPGFHGDDPFRGPHASGQASIHRATPPVFTGMKYVADHTHPAGSHSTARHVCQPGASPAEHVGGGFLCTPSPIDPTTTMVSLVLSGVGTGKAIFFDRPCPLGKVAQATRSPSRELRDRTAEIRREFASNGRGETYDSLKRLLPASAMAIHVPQGTPQKDFSPDATMFTGLYPYDLDVDLDPEDRPAVFAAMVAWQHTVLVGHSPSGDLYAVVAGPVAKDRAEFKVMWGAIAADLPGPAARVNHGSRAAATKLRFLPHDPNLWLASAPVQPHLGTPPLDTRRPTPPRGGAFRPTRKTSLPSTSNDTSGKLKKLAAHYGGTVSQNLNLRIPCPAHGGDNPTGLSVSPGEGGLLVRCLTRGCSYPDIARAIEQDTGVQIGRNHTQGRTEGRNRRPDNPALPERNSGTTDWGRTLWQRAARIPSDPAHPARQWLADRRLWRPGHPLPDCIQWLDAHKVDSRHLGAGSIIVMAAPWTAWAEAWPGLPTLTAVNLVAITADGQKTRDRTEGEGGVDKRSLGSASGAVTCLGDPHSEETPRVTEGLADALAIAAWYRGPVYATLGKNGMAGAHADFLDALAASHAPEPPIIHTDNDVPGLEAALSLQRKLADRGVAARVVGPPVGKDPADAAHSLPGFPPVNATAARQYVETMRAATNLPLWEIYRQASFDCREETS